MSELLQNIEKLFNQELHSDLNIRLRNGTIKSHKLILYLRSNNWGVSNLYDIHELDWQDMDYDVGYALLEWVYTDRVNLQNKNDQFFLGKLGLSRKVCSVNFKTNSIQMQLIEFFFSLNNPDRYERQGFLKASKKFKLKLLVEICEQYLIACVNKEDCVKFYQLADEIGVKNLRNHCSQLISSYSASQLFELIKSKTNFPLHTAITIRREDMVRLFLDEFKSNLSAKVNEFDEQDGLPLDMALKNDQKRVASNLLKHKADVNIQDRHGRSLLHRAIERYDKQSIAFLLTNGSIVDIPNKLSGETPLHLLCSQEATNEKLDKIARLLLRKGANPNLQLENGNTCLHLTIVYQNVDVFKAIISNVNTQLGKQNRDGLSALDFCLQKIDPSENSIYRRLADLLINSVKREKQLHENRVGLVEVWRESALESENYLADFVDKLRTRLSGKTLAAICLGIGRIDKEIDHELRFEQTSFKSKKDERFQGFGELTLASAIQRRLGITNYQISDIALISQLLKYFSIFN